MTIASEITRINNNIAAAYTAASGKGATLPATENSANLATCIGSISGGSSSKFGANLDTFIGEIDANGKLQLPTEQSDLVFTGVQSIVNLIYKFTRTGIKSVSFPDLVSLASGSSISGAFYDCPNNTSANFGALQEVSKSYALQMLDQDRNLKLFNFIFKNSSIPLEVAISASTVEANQTSVLLSVYENDYPKGATDGDIVKDEDAKLLISDELIAFLGNTYFSASG